MHRLVLCVSRLFVLFGGCIMSWLSLLSILNLFFTGTLAGVEVASHYGFVTHPTFLGEADQIRLRQALIRRLRVLVPAMFGPAFLTTVAITMLSATGLKLDLRGAALTADACWIYARIIATVRINSDTINWDPDAPPPRWPGLVAKAERFHIAGLWAVTTAFLCLLIAEAL